MRRNLRYLLTLLLVVLMTPGFAQPKHGKMVIGYYAQWSIYARDYNVWKIGADKLTHLHYAFFGTTYDAARPENTALRSLDPYADFEHNEGAHPWDAAVKGNFGDLKKLKEQYPHLKIIISVGGWTESQDFPAIAANATARTALANSMKQMMTTYPFIDGFDIDWEFPVEGGTDGTETINGRVIRAQPHDPKDAENLLALFREMRRVMPSASLSLAASNNVTGISKQFIGPNNKAQFGVSDCLTDYANYITFFGYDLGGNWFDKTSYNAPLYGSRDANDPLYAADASKDVSVSNLVNVFRTQVGVPASQLAMGVPFYGKIYENVETTGGSSTLPGLYRKAPRATGTCTNPQPPKGTWDYTSCENSGSIEFCDLAGTVGTNAHHILNMNDPSQVAAAGWTRYWDPVCKVPYLYNSTLKQFISYEDEQSIQEKVKYLASQGLAGAMIWELSQDTRSETPTQNLLLTTIDETLNSNISVVAVSGATLTSTGNAIANVKLNLINGTGSIESTTTSAANGTYSFANVFSGGSYTVSATKTGYSFSNLSLGTVSTDLTGQNLIGSVVPTVAIAGKTQVADGSAIAGVTVTLNEGSTVVATGTSDASGNFSFAGVNAGVDYTIKASKAGYDFVDKSLGVVQADLTNQIVIGEVPANLVYGFVKNGSTPVSGAIVQLVLNWQDNSHPYQTLTATTDASGRYQFENSKLAGYTALGSIQLNGWQNNNVAYFPASYSNKAIGTTAVEYSFNSQEAPAPTFTIAGKTATSQGTSIAAATVSLWNNTGSLVATTSSDASGNYSFKNINSGVAYVLKGSKTGYSFADVSIATLSANLSGKDIVGTVIPLIDIAGKTLDEDGSAMPGVTVNLLNSNKAIVGTTTSDDAGRFSFTSVNSGVSYTLTASMSGYAFAGKTLVAGTNNMVDQNLVGLVSTCHSLPLPSKVILGYAHTWENTSAPFLFFKDIADKTKFNVVMYSFIETSNRDGYTPELTINSPRYTVNNVFNEQLLKDDIAYLRAKGIPVLVSIGGMNGHVVLETTAQKNIFVQGIKSIVDKYGFDGLDLDFEGGSMAFGGGALKDFSYQSISAYPKLKNIVDACKEIKQNYGSCFIMTCAPETYYVQVGYSIYSDGPGAFLPVIDNLRDELDLVMVQLYNTGSITALDGKAYSQATPDFLVSMTDMLHTGFNVGATGYRFNGLPADKLIVGIPSTGPAAPAGGYIAPAEAQKALDYMRFGTSYSGRAYTLRSGNFEPRGVMTWSINWDAAASPANNFGNSFYDYFYNSTGNDEVAASMEDELIVYPNPVRDWLSLSIHSNVTSAKIVDMLGRTVATYSNLTDKKLSCASLASGIYYLVIYTESGKQVTTKFIKD